MPEERTEADARANAASIEQVEATETLPRGNVHSERDEARPEQDAPPPLSH